ncbi:MAG: hypothetical protein IJ802_04040, partial [Kiritimatiellae bacterium]|nr:hypothetical protein [Kiritimatiellia bacterium]
MFVHVAVDLALDKLLTYKAEGAIAEKLRTGQLLRVPFRSKTAKAFAMRLEEFPPPGMPEDKIKSVLEIIDDAPFFSPAMLQLVKWIAAYTLSPIETCLRTAVPAAVLKDGAKAREQLYVNIACSAADGQGHYTLTQRQQALLCDIARVGGGWLQDVVKEFKTTVSTLRHLERAGALAIE